MQNQPMSKLALNERSLSPKFGFRESPSENDFTSWLIFGLTPNLGLSEFQRKTLRIQGAIRPWPSSWIDPKKGPGPLRFRSKVAKLSKVHHVERDI